ncbi:aspartate 1-decarboxylase [Helicobacter saguini]|uniref:Aspartate 1-decarboxylase n=1 Tax=Helicobacter saguini TaxID=1548018 RepID=A0A347VTS6_9HELI|nr:aspartate 1-decarboxylase [Helicobacter saguini]MWV61724.1 aspartate 1-decarboxylase [Helicobacter saguini]MWV67604.1 aspartate 1-decarboxylase [Helicobacter saguini]MWV69955.1 aspartate 1-decarboxylase [Helicobacter saguini]MWV72831.1 aspartate 1-decarboxylase [Helicobacter saguini]TLD92397.1 aspartate 1-decarboxylase [Helicobacter saguini]
MRVDMLFAKIHRCKVTEANLNYVGSISIDSKLMDAAGIMEGMKVDVVNINNGERFTTYAIPAKANSGVICINGAAARKAHSGDIVIIIAYANMKLKAAKNFKPKIVFVDSNNRIVTKGEVDV